MSYFKNIKTGEIERINFDEYYCYYYTLNDGDDIIVFYSKDKKNESTETLESEEISKVLLKRNHIMDTSLKRKYLPSISDLIDRLSIDLLKVVFISDKEEIYQKEIDDIMNDIDIILESLKDNKLTSNLIKAILILGQINTHIWYNEKDARRREDQDLQKLKLTHSLNGIRNLMKNRILENLEEKGFDYKIDCLASEFKEWNSLCK
jgi:hypothetical protein